MKKAFALVLVIALCLGLCACSGTQEEPKSLSSRAGDEVKSQITFYVSMMYEIVGLPTVTTFVKEVSENEFQVTGKVTVRDNYGDTYTGKYDATAIYDPATDDFDVDYELDKLYKE